MNFKLKEWQKVKSNGTHTVLRNKQGHELKIAHKPLSKSMKSELDALPHFAKGGNTEDESSMTTAKKSIVNAFGTPSQSSSPKPSAPTPRDPYQNFADVAARKKKMTADENTSGMAHGGQVQHYKSGGMAHQDDEQPPVVINVGQPEQSSMQRAGQYVHDVVGKGVEDAAGAFKTVGAPIINAGTDFVQGLAGSPTPDTLPATQSEPTVDQQQPQLVTPNQQQAMAPAATQQPIAPAKPNTYEADMVKGLKREQAGADIMQQAAEDQGDAEEEALIASQKAQQTALKTYNTNLLNLQAEHDAFVTDVQNAHIKPNQYMDSMDTGQKIMSAIGLILGGIGSGLSGRDNMASQYINQQISRDIDAQKAKLGKAENLLSMNLKQFGNLRDATEMTRAMQLGVVSDQLKMAAAKARGPQAQAAAMMEKGKIDQQIAQIHASVAAQKVVQDVTNQAQQDPAKIPDMIRMMEQVDPKKAQDMRERYVPGVGMANTAKDATDVKIVRTTNTQAQDAIKKLVDIAHMPSGLGKELNPEVRAKAGSLQTLLTGSLREMALGPGAMTQTEYERLKALIPNPTDIMSLNVNTLARLKTLSENMQNFEATALRARGLTPGVGPVEQSLSPEQQKMVEWAKRYPNDIRSPMILKKFGL